jgi:hypothetical protein
MPIHYALYENKLTETPNEYAGRVQTLDSVGLNELADQIVDQGTTVRKADILAVLENMCLACENFLIMGFRVQIGGVCELFPRIKGNFVGPEDTFDPARHTIEVGANAGARIRKAVQERAKVTKNATILPKPDPLGYADLGSGQVNSTVTVGSIGTVYGARLRTDDEVADEGIFFVNTADGSETQVPPANIQKNSPGELVFLIPFLADGNYNLQVRAHFSKDGQLRTGTLSAELTVQGVPPI